MNKTNRYNEPSELRDIFAALAMQSLINQEAATHKWVATKHTNMLMPCLTNAMASATMETTNE